MKTFYEAISGLVTRSSVALGFFDGVHPGHQVVIGKAIADAKRLGITSAIITFKDHPRTLVEGNAPPLLTVIEQRLALFEALGVEAALVLSFTEELCRLSAQQYVQNILVESMGANSVSVGYNHHFGKDREGDAKLLGQLGKEMGFAVSVTPAVFVEGLEVSSSRIREYLRQGQVELAKKLLSRPYALYGTVVTGDRRGRTINFPTANLACTSYQMLPGPGVYAGSVSIVQENSYHALAQDKVSQTHTAVINIGYRPTFQSKASELTINQLSASSPSVEAHILNFSQDIYGCKLELSFNKRLRDEMKFDGIQQLQLQIEKDCQDTLNFFARAQ